MNKIFIIFLISSAAFAQNIRLSGFVYNAETKEPVPHVNIRLAETTQGTSTNSEGKFVFSVNKDKPKLIFSAVGYKKEIVEIASHGNISLDVSLKPEPIQLMEIVVGADEDPAYKIVREAIKRKEQNRAGLNSLQYDFFSKDIFLSAGEVAMVSEKFSTGYYQTGKNEKIITHSVSITENEKRNALKFDQNILDKIYIDFTEDMLMIVGNTVFLPLALNAFDWYDYKLREVKQAGTKYEYIIEVIPESKLQPLLRGKIVIEDSTYALKSIQLSNSEGLRFPFVNDFQVGFVQNRELFEKYWLPIYQKVQSSLELNFAGLIGTDQIAMDQVSLFTDYKINAAIPDSIYQLYPAIEGENQRDSSGIKYFKTSLLNRAEMDSLRPIPLTSTEEKAYKELDSTMRVVSQIKYKGLLSGVVAEAINNNEKENSGNRFLKYAIEAFSYLKLGDNRVNGILFGGRYKSSVSSDVLKLEIGLGYAFGRKKFEGTFSTSYIVKNFFIDGIQFALFDETKQTQLLNPYPDFLNGINVFLGFEDQFNYYHSRGFSLGFWKRIKNNISANAKFIYDEQKSLREMKYQSIFNTNREVRINPSIIEGNDNRISVGLLWGTSPYTYMPIQKDGLIAQLDISNPLFGSIFNYKRFKVTSQVSTKTIYDELFSAPYFLFGFESEFVLGGFGPQHTITPTSALNVYSPFLSFKTLKTYEYVGDKFISIFAEHNWRTIPFQSLGLTFLADLNIDIITGVNLLKMWNESNYFINKTRNSIFWEGYFSLARILGIGRIDFSHGANKRFVVRLGLATVL